MTEDTVTATELSKNLSASLPVDDAFIGSRSLGCQTVDSRNLDDLYIVGMIKYSLTVKLLGTKLSSEKRLSTCKVEQKGRTPLPHNRTHTSAGSRLMPCRNDDPNIQKLPLCEHSHYVHERQTARNRTYYRKKNIISVKARHSSVEAESNLLKFLSTYQRRIINKYLIKHRQAITRTQRNASDVFLTWTRPSHVTLKIQRGKKPL
jgi:hypothetical protein